MPEQRAKFKKLLACWIDKKLHKAALGAARNHGLSTADYIAGLIERDTGAKPSGQQTARSGIASGKLGKTHGSWRLKQDDG